MLVFGRLGARRVSWESAYRKAYHPEKSLRIILFKSESFVLAAFIVGGSVSLVCLFVGLGVCMFLCVL